ncbi:hypothetical protein H5P28_05180 [Ruficoccus amylovorans]|uniref:Uncharacterized protein n=1 Tax=Ruficoccus amylovorans TaxID=1804625 RepID=A0A842HBK0_9BACT|nr:hypothetical protein [Ruficoccus amylovorans]MBC2593650.1 hypothetical protein [Ruficoccus amylovorans]
MILLRRLICLLLFSPITTFAFSDLPLFPSKSELVALSNTDGVVLNAVIHDVWPDRQSVRIFVRDKGDSFDLPLSAFDEPSQQLLKDWYFKRLISERLNLKSERETLRDTHLRGPRDNLPTPESGARDVKVNESTRAQQVKTKAYNSSTFPLTGLEVRYGVQVVRTISGDRKGEYAQMYLTEIHELDIPGRNEIVISSEALPLIDYRLRYETVSSGFDAYGRPMEYTTRKTIKSDDRIAAYYVLVYYKGELVAGDTNQPRLIEDSMKYLAKTPGPSSGSRLERGDGATVAEPTFPRRGGEEVPPSPGRLDFLR